MTDAPLVLRQWTTFYEIIGSSAGALTGLQFVTMALIAEAQAARSMLEIRAFGTPTIVHFCATLLIAAIACAPWQSLSSVATCLGAVGIAGLIYAIRVIRHARKQTGYTPDTGDWAWYVALPLASHATLLIGAVVLRFHPAKALFVIASAVATLLFAGIHNAWDTATYIAIEHRRTHRESHDEL